MPSRRASVTGSNLMSSTVWLHSTYSLEEPFFINMIKNNQLKIITRDAGAWERGNFKTVRTIIKLSSQFQLIGERENFQPIDFDHEKLSAVLNYCTKLITLSIMPFAWAARLVAGSKSGLLTISRKAFWTSFGVFAVLTTIPVHVTNVLTFF